MLGGGGIAEQDSAVLGGGGIAEHEESAWLGGGGIAEQEDSAVLGGGGIAEPERAVRGGGGIAEQEDSAWLGGGGIAEQEDSAVLGGGGIAEQEDSAVLGGGGITEPERALPNSILLIVRLRGQDGRAHPACGGIAAAGRPSRRTRRAGRRRDHRARACFTELHTANSASSRPGREGLNPAWCLLRGE